MPEPRSGKTQITVARLSFPNLFKPKAFKPTDEPTFNCTAILNKVDDAEQIMTLRKVATAVAHEKWGAVLPKGIKICIRDGGEEGKADTEGYGPDVVFIPMTSRKPVSIVDEHVAPLPPQSGKPYAGCYCNFSVRLWAQDNEYGKRINCQLNAVQFVSDGEAFGEAPINVKEEFSDLGGGDGGAAEGEQAPQGEEGDLLG